MSQFEILQKTALSFPETTEEPHFEKSSFRVKKKIFTTYNSEENKANLKFSEKDQDIFSLMGKEAIYPVPNKWGKQGWTVVELDKLSDDMLIDALKAAYCAVAPKKLSEKIDSVDNK